MHVKKIKTNIKYDREVDFSPLTIVSGANASGKTGLLESYSLVLTGESARFGKDGKKALAATVFSQEGESREASIIAQLDDGSTATWTCSGTPEKSSRPKWDTPAAASIVRGNGLEAIRDGGAKLTDWLVQIAGDEPTEEKTHKDMMVFLAAVDHLTWLALWNKDPKDRFNPSALSSVRRDADKKKRSHSAVLKEIATAREGNLAPLRPEEKVELASLNTKLNFEVSGSQQEPTEIYDELQGVLETLEAKELAPIRLTVDMQSLFAQFRTFLTVAGKDKMRCPCCKESVLTVKQLSERIEALGATLAKNEQSYNLVKELSEKAVALRLEMRKPSSQISSKPITKEELERLNELKLRQAEFDRLSALVTQEQVIKQEIDSIKRVIEIIDKLRQQYAAKGADILQKLSSRVLPKGMTIECKLQKGNYTLGLERRGFWFPISTLSGAESAMVLAAVEASVCANKDTPIRCLVIDDVWFDRKTLIDLVKALTPHVGEDKALTQVIINCVEWRGKDPKGWTRVDLDAMLKAEIEQEDTEAAQEVGEPDLEAATKEIAPGVDDLEL